MSKSALQTVQSFQMSLGSGTEDWMDLVAEDVTFEGPVDQVSGKEKFIELNKGFFPMVRGYEPLNAFENGKFVCLEGTLKVESPKGNVIALTLAEVYAVEQEKIKSVRIYYDAEEFRREFSK